MTVDLTPILHDVFDVLGAVAAACVPIVSAFAIRKLHLDVDAAHRDSLNTALNNSIGEAIRVGEKYGDPRLSSVDIKNQGLAAMVSYVEEKAPAAVAFFPQATPAELGRMAANALAKQLNNSATVTANAPVPAPLPAVAGTMPIALVHPV